MLHGEWGRYKVSRIPVFCFLLALPSPNIDPGSSPVSYLVHLGGGAWAIVQASQDFDTAAGSQSSQDSDSKTQASFNSLRLRGTVLPLNSRECKLSQASHPAWAQVCCCLASSFLCLQCSEAQRHCVPLFSGEDDVRNLPGLGLSPINTVEITGWELEEFSLKKSMFFCLYMVLRITPNFTKLGKTWLKSH